LKGILGAGVSKLNKTKYNLTESLRKTINRMNELVKKDGYKIDFEYREDVYVCADEVKITQAFYNLLLNAITHSGDDKAVIVRQSSKDNAVKIEVIDHGEGIKESDLPYIWERYYKVDKKHKRPIMGTGLGLSIVKKLLKCTMASMGLNQRKGKAVFFGLKQGVIIYLQNITLLFIGLFHLY